jgi:uncharacterized membrane-anchored protein
MMEEQKNVIDYIAGGTTFAAVIGILPHIATALTVVWFIIRIWESPTARRLLRAVCTRCADWWEAR